MTNSEKDELAGEYGLNLPDSVSDEQARYIKTSKDIQRIFDFMRGKKMKLYEIDAAIEALVDENGEITDFDALDALVMARDEKLENVALYYKDTAAEAAALKNEIDNLTARKKSAEARAERLKSYLEYALNGDKFSTARVEVGFRKSSKVIVDDEDTFKAAYPQFVKTTVKISLTDIRNALKTQDINGARLVESQNIQIR